MFKQYIWSQSQAYPGKKYVRWTFTIKLLSDLLWIVCSDLKCYSTMNFHGNLATLQFYLKSSLFHHTFFSWVYVALGYIRLPTSLHPQTNPSPMSCSYGAVNYFFMYLAANLRSFIQSIWVRSKDAIPQKSLFLRTVFEHISWFPQMPHQTLYYWHTSTNKYV